MIIDEEDYLAHYGTPRHSGRYPWGSGGNNPTQSDARSLLQMINELRAKGMKDPAIAKALGMESTTQLRAQVSIARNEQKQADISRAARLRAEGNSNVAIGRIMGINESSVRALLAPSEKHKADVLQATSSMLKNEVDTKGYIDVGVGVERYMGIARTKLDTAIALLRTQGYALHTIQVDQLGATGKTLVKVLAPPGTQYRDIAANKDKIHQLKVVSSDGGLSYTPIMPPLSVNSKRVAIRYAEEGGADHDGVVYVRPGVADVSLGQSRYAQVRIAVDGTHFIKGMAMYKDDLPDGVDLMFNTNKSSTGNKLDALKPLKDDPDGPFGAQIKRQLTERDKDGKHRVTSAMNIVNEEGDWDDWSRTLSSQMLSKQRPFLAKQQLDMTYERRTQELDRIMALTNPEVRRKLLREFSESVDSAAVHLKAAALPRQRTQVILPISSVKDNEVYAPNFDNGEKVVLIRFPHGGKFEIPELTVNNRNREARRSLGDAKDAIGINSKVAQRLSGADFDGDTVLVIPNNKGAVKTTPALPELKGFDPQAIYKLPDDAPKMSSRTKGIEMGKVSNLITDMTIRGASDSEIARAVRHSMVVIDAEKHHLNYKQSELDHGIAALREKYQNSRLGGASTVISNSGTKATIRIPERKERSAKKGGPIDPATGKKVYEDTGETYIQRRTNPKTGVVTEKVVKKTIELPKLAYADAHEFSSGTPIEKLYADHSNRLKELANRARREQVRTKALPYSSSARKTYAAEVASLNAKLNIALKNAPLERQAQLVGNAILSQKRRANPDMDDAELRKERGRALRIARERIGAKKIQVEITDSEWDAIQAGAIAPTKLREILRNTDPEAVKKRATPREQLVMTSQKLSTAKTMAALGYTQAEIAAHLGVSLTTLKDAL